MELIFAKKERNQNPSKSIPEFRAEETDSKKNHRPTLGPANGPQRSSCITRRKQSALRAAPPERECKITVSQKTQ